jgi:replication initiation protein RepC
LKRSFDEITICRRAAEEALSALAQHHPAIDRSAIENRLVTLKARTPKRSGSPLPAGLLEAWNDMRLLAEEAYYQAGCGGTECRQIEAEKGSPSETCDKGIQVETQPADPTRLPPLLALIVEACPVVANCAHPIRGIADVVAAGRFLRASLGAHRSSWDEAVEEVGAVQAATAVIYVLQLHDDDVSSGRNRIRNAGGYFRSIVRLIKAGQFDLEAELLTLRRRKML